MDIKPIQIRQLRIPEIESQTLPPPIVSSLDPPITVNIGLPIVDMPGCVEARNDNNGSQAIFGDDPEGVVTLCGPGVPSYDPINYEPEQMILTGPAETPPVEPPPKTPPVKTPEVPPPPPPPGAKCPTEAQALKEPIGTLVDGGTKKIVEYRLVGKECIPIKEDLKIPDQIIKAIPSAGSITTTASIAVVATTSALLAKPLADLLLKVVKPVVKKVIKKIAAIRGKKITVESVKDRRDQQRIRSHAIRKLKGKE
jgi:hypothetical protein